MEKQSGAKITISHDPAGLVSFLIIKLLSGHPD
jgi:hypothetical protein